MLPSHRLLQAAGHHSLLLSPQLLQFVKEEFFPSFSGGEPQLDTCFHFFNFDFSFFLSFLSFLGPHPWHMEVPRLGVESEL